MSIHSQLSDAVSGIPILAVGWQEFLTNQTVDFWISRPILLAVLLVCLQLILLSLLGRGGARILKDRYCQISQLWLAIVCLGLFLIPFQLLVGGWSLNVPRPEATKAVEQGLASRAIQPEQPQPADLQDPAAVHPPFVIESDLDLQLRADMRTPPHSTVTEEMHESSEGRRPGDGSQRASTAPATQTGYIELMSFSRLGQPFFSQVSREQYLIFGLLLVYVSGAAWLFMLSVCGGLRLRTLCRSGMRIDPVAYPQIESTAKLMNLPKPPMVYECIGLTVPLTCGLRDSRVLVPHGFLQWDVEEQRLVLLHEFAHIRRRDLAGELLARGLSALCWFHPATWSIVREHRSARELATDALVVAAGADRFQYANCLVSVIERMSQQAGPTQQLPAVAMSATCNIQSRVKALVSEQRSRAGSQRSLWIMLVVLGCSLLGSSFRLQAVPSGQTQDDRSAEGDQTADDPILIKDVSGVLRFNTQRLQPSVSLAERIRNCLVTPVTEDNHGPIFYVTGTVTNVDGLPAAGVTVVLRESTQMRVSSQPELLERSDRHLLAVPDVFAKTVTDAQGRYAFTDVKSPSLPTDRFRNQWTWNVVAADEEHVGLLVLDSARMPVKSIDQANITLEETQSIQTIVVDQQGIAVPEAVVHLAELKRPGQSGAADSFQTWMGVFTPIIRANARGEVTFSHLPVSRVASLLASHPDYVGGRAMVATSNDVPIGENTFPAFPDEPSFVTQASPANIQMEVGNVVRGRVTAEGQPVAGVRVGLSSSVSVTRTDRQGDFELRYSDFQTRGRPLQVRCLPPKGSTLLNALATINEEALEGDQPIEIELARGVRVVGKVLCGGEPVAGIRAGAKPTDGEPHSISIVGRSTEDGSFEFVVPPRSTKIFLTTDVPGYKLAGTADGRRAQADSLPADWPQCSLDLSEADAGRTIALDPLLIEATDAITVQAFLPDGQPASRGEVTIKDKSVRNPDFPDQILVETALLDESGQATLQLPGVPTQDAYADVRVTNEHGGFAGRQLLSEVGATGVLKVTLQPGVIVRGRVLLNGQPVLGAEVVISKAEPPDDRGGFRTVPVATVQTNDDGFYSAGVERVPRYSIFVRRIPGIQDQPFQGHSARPTATDVVEVDLFDFQNGSQEIRGVVQDSNRRPLAGVSIGVDPTYKPDGRPILLGYRSASQLTTDEQGRFFLRQLPQGKFQIRAHSKQNGQGRLLTAEVEAEAGEENVKIFIETNAAPATPRLKVQSITDY